MLIDKKNRNVAPLFSEFIKRNKFILSVIIVTLIIGGMMEVFPATYMQRIVDGLIDQTPFSEILSLVALWYGCRLVGSIANYCSGFLTGKIAARCGRFFRDLIFTRIIKSYYWDRNIDSTSDVTTRVLNDASEIGDVIIKPLFIVGKNLTIFIWSVIFLARIDWILLLTCVPLGFVMLFLGGKIATKSKKVVKDVKIQETKLTKVIIETMGAIEDIIIYGFGSHQLQKFKKSSESVETAQIEGAHLLTALESSMDVLWPVATVLSLAFGSYRVLTGNLSVGGLVAFMWYVQW
ncbi:MAG: ABC transporter transmembrane domain-containing protein [Anaerolineaceae bacterium]